MLGRVRVLATIACMSACAHAPKPAPPRPPLVLPNAKARAPRPPPPAEWFWEPVLGDVHAPPRKPLALPVPESAIVKNDAVWNSLSAEAKEKLRASGSVVVGADTEPLPASALSFGAFYKEQAERKAPLLVTTDALFALTRLGLEGAVAQAEEQLLPVLDSLLARLDTRLTAEQKGVNATLQEAYRIARGIIAVARVVNGTKSGPPDLAAAVNAERALIEAHAVSAMSPVLGYSVDYTRFVVPSDAAHPNAFRALSWLGTAAFPVAARAEAPGAPLDVAQARTTTRAAMLLARLCDADVDAETSALYARLTRFLAFVWGASDDLTFAELDAMGTKAEVDLTKPEHIIDVAKVDKVRFAAMKSRAPLVYDGPGSTPFGAGRSARMFGGHASPDAIAISQLLGAAVGGAEEGAPPSLQRNGMRVVPTTLDLAAWLEAPGARAALHETRADAFEQFEPRLKKLVDDRDLDAFHSSIADSFLVAAGALASDLSSNPASDAPGPRLEAVLSAWTTARHLDQPFARAAPKPSAGASGPGSAAAGAATRVVLVEAAPEAIARLVATTRQARRGLEGINAVAPDSAASAMLTSLEETLRIALTAAQHRTNDEPLAAAELSAIGELPSRLAMLEEGASGAAGAQQIACVVATDPPSRRVLVTALGRIEPVYELTRDIGRDEPLLVVGAHIAHHEIVTDAGEIPTDATWRAKVGTAARAAYTAPFRVAPSGAAAGAPRPPAP